MPKKAGKCVRRGPAPSSRRRGAKGTWSKKKGSRRTKVQSRRANVTATTFLERSRQELMRYNLAPKKAKKSTQKKSKTNKAPSGGRPIHLLPIRATGSDEVEEKELWASLHAFDEENRRCAREKEARKEKKRKEEERGSVDDDRLDIVGKSEVRKGSEEKETKGKKVMDDRELSEMTRNERRKLRLRREQMATKMKHGDGVQETEVEDEREQEQRGGTEERNGEKTNGSRNKEETEAGISREGTQHPVDKETEGSEQVKRTKRYLREVRDDETVFVQTKKKKIPAQHADVNEEKEKTKKSETKGSANCQIVRQKGETYASFTKRVDAWARESLRTSAPSESAPTAKASTSESKKTKEARAVYNTG